MSLTVTVHRGTRQIGGSVIEIAHPNGERLLLDAGQALDLGDGEQDQLPSTLDLAKPAAVLLTHAHLDHWGLVHKLPTDWRVHCGKATARLIKAAPFADAALPHEFQTWCVSGSAVQIGAFRVTVYLTDHSAFDAYMLQIDGAERRVFYTGDFRRHGRKSTIVDRLMANPPKDVDLLITEGTNLGTEKPTVTETELEADLVARASKVQGRIFVAWSGQNIDRTVTLYRAAKQTGRDLIIDLYTADILEQIAEGTGLPRPGFPNLKVVITRALRHHYSLLRGEAFIERMLPHAVAADKLQGSQGIIMLRQGLVKDYRAKGVVPTAQDLFLWSMWEGYLAKGDKAFDWCKSAGTPMGKLHTSGHASTADLMAFAAAIAPKAIVPVHGQNWYAPPDGFGPILNVTDGAPIILP
jgi:ribonuclease J